MKRKEYEKWVDYIDENFGVPKIICSKEDYGQNWIKEFKIVQFLSRTFDKYEPAFRLSKWILNRELTCKHDNIIDNCIKCIEEKAWLLKDLGSLYWIVEKDIEKALEYTEQSLEVAESTTEEFSVVGRGEIFIQKLRCLKVLEREEEALEEADNKIKFMKEEMPEVKLNSYLFYSYLFKAEMEEEKDNWKGAATYLREGFKYHELLEGQKEEIKRLWKNKQNNYQELYEGLKKFRRSIIFWEI